MIINNRKKLSPLLLLIINSIEYSNQNPEYQFSNDQI